MTKAIAMEYTLLISSGDAVKLVTMKPVIPEFYKSLYEKIPIKTLSTGAKSNSIFSGVVVGNINLSKVSISQIFLEAISIFKALRKEKIDLVLFHESYPAVLSIPFLLLFRQKFAIYLHDNPYMAIETNNGMHIKTRNKLVKLVLTFILGRSDVILCVSQRLKDTISSNVKNGNAVYLPLGIERPNDFPNPSERTIVLTYSFWDRWRMPETYLRLVNSIPVNTKLVIAGRWHDQDYLKEFRQKISKSGIEKQVLLLTDITEEKKKDLLMHSIVFVRFGFNELGLPGGLLEAQGYGCPCIVNRELGGSSLITHGENGYIVDSIEEAGEKIIYLSNNAAILSAMSRNSYERSKELSWNSHAKRLKMLFENVM